MKKALAAITLILSVVSVSMFIAKSDPSKLREYRVGGMFVVPNHPFSIFASNLDPIENRGENVHKWLAPSLKISVNKGSGSGTIVYYDDKEGYAYIQSCGHLWSGNMTAEEGKRKKLTCKVISWFHNNEKLSSPKTYTADVLYYNNGLGNDVSLLRFKPDWEPYYFPISDKDHILSPGEQLISTGCDSGDEVAQYDVEVIGYENTAGGRKHLITKNNSPRPGRSGGGLMTKDGAYVGICVRTSDVTGNGIGLFTTLEMVRHYNKINGYEWLNEVGNSLARKIPIKDRNNPQGQYPKNYIPLPNGR